MKCSICIATYNKPYSLDKTLASIVSQRPPFEYEVIVADDGSAPIIAKICRQYPVQYHRVEKPEGIAYRNPAVARNVAYRAATGDVVICQSDDVAHTSPHDIANLVGHLQPERFVIATVINVDKSGNPYSNPHGPGYGDRLQVYASPERRRPLFFLGALYRKDLYAVGGNDEEFIGPGCEDQWFALCLTQGLELKPIFVSDVVGHHLHHTHTQDWAGIAASRRVFDAKLRRAAASGLWYASSGPWPYHCATPAIP